jgi:hypothetical protein
LKRPDDDYFTVETCSLIITQSIYVVSDCIFQYIIYSNQHNGMESVKSVGVVYFKNIVLFLSTYVKAVQSAATRAAIPAQFS